MRFVVRAGLRGNVRLLESGHLAVLLLEAIESHHWGSVRWEGAPPVDFSRRVVPLLLLLGLLFNLDR